MAGRPLTIEKQISESDAVLYAFHGGTMAGPALADLIFGKAVPSGKLPVTFPRMVGQIPVYYAHKNTGRPGTNFVTIDKIPIGVFQTSLGNTSFHLDAGDKPMYPFGFGLSYTTFEYSKVKLSSKKLDAKTKITAECTITNTGKMEAKEVVQLYVRDVAASLARPIRELKGFEKITLKVGESKNVKFEISADQLGFWNLENKYISEPGEFRVWISKDSQSGESVSFRLE
jgi:beta-glucosidase